MFELNADVAATLTGRRQMSRMRVSRGRRRRRTSEFRRDAPPGARQHGHPLRVELEVPRRAHQPDEQAGAPLTWATCWGAKCRRAPRSAWRRDWCTTEEVPRVRVRRKRPVVLESRRPRVRRLPERCRASQGFCVGGSRPLRFGNTARGKSRRMGFLDLGLGGPVSGLRGCHRPVEDEDTSRTGGEDE